MRRLPVYLLIDCSESMAGDAIEAVHSGIATMMNYLRTDPHALETVFVSIITFNNSARQVVPLTELSQFQVPELVLGSGTALGAALDLWSDCLIREVVKTTAERKGDYKPLCFILTDGNPTDSWEAQAKNIKSQISGRKAFVVAIACGIDANAMKLKQITDDVLLSSDFKSNSINGLFRWITASVSTASQSIESSGTSRIDLDKLPSDVIMKATESELTSFSDEEQFAFLHAKCIASKGFYIMRFQLQAASKGLFGKEKQPLYLGVSSHKLDQFDFNFTSNESNSRKVTSDRLVNPPPCPYCENPIWAMCACGKIHCSPQVSNKPITLTCPWCGNTGEYRPATFDVGRSQG